MSANEKQGGGLFLALLLIIVTAPTQWGLGGKIPFSPVDIVLGLAFLGWAVLALRRRAEVGLPPLCLWAVVGVGFVSAVNVLRAMKTEQAFTLLSPGFTISGNAMGMAKELIQLVEYLLVVYVVVWAALRNGRQVRQAAWALVAATGAVILLGVAHYFSNSAGDQSFYVRSTFGSRYVYGGFLAMALPMLFALALVAEEKWVRVGLLAVVVVGAVTILSPGALVGLAVALPLVASRISSRALQGTLVGLLAFGALTAVALPRNYKENVYNPLRFKYEDDQMNEVLKAQWLEWIAGTHLALEVPVLGVGPGNFQLNIGPVYGSALNMDKPRKAQAGPDAYAGKTMEPDMNNLYLVTAASTGLLGLAALLWVLIYFGRTAAAAARRAGDEVLKAIALGAWGGIIAFSITSVYSSLLVRGTGVVLALLFGIAMVLRAKEWAGESEDGSRGLRMV